MMVKFFRRGKGGSAGPINYLLGKNRDREKARVLAGDIEEVGELIDSNDFNNKYTSGCLSFEENNISPILKKTLMQDFEECLFPGLDKSNYRALWVEHLDKGRLELNFLIPNVELKTGKRLKPYIHQKDLNKVNLWKDLINYKHQFTDPNLPSKKQTVTINKDLPKDKKQVTTAINKAITDMIAAGLINDRNDVINFLTSSGLTISRTTKSSISIKLDEVPIRLKGAFYEQDFRSSGISTKNIRNADREYNKTAEQRYRFNEQEYNKIIIEQRKENKKKYTPAQQQYKKSTDSRIQKNNKSNDDNINNINNFKYRAGFVDLSKYKKIHRDDSKAEHDNTAKTNANTKEELENDENRTSITGSIKQLINTATTSNNSIIQQAKQNERGNAGIKKLVEQVNRTIKHIIKLAKNKRYKTKVTPLGTKKRTYKT